MTIMLHCKRCRHQPLWHELLISGHNARGLTNDSSDTAAAGLGPDFGPWHQEQLQSPVAIFVLSRAGSMLHTFMSDFVLCSQRHMYIHMGAMLDHNTE